MFLGENVTSANVTFGRDDDNDGLDPFRSRNSTAGDYRTQWVSNSLPLFVIFGLLSALALAISSMTCYLASKAKRLLRLAKNGKRTIIMTDKSTEPAKLYHSDEKSAKKHSGEKILHNESLRTSHKLLSPTTPKRRVQFDSKAKKVSPKKLGPSKKVDKKLIAKKTKKSHEKATKATNKPKKSEESPVEGSSTFEATADVHAPMMPFAIPVDVPDLDDIVDVIEESGEETLVEESDEEVLEGPSGDSNSEEPQEKRDDEESEQNEDIKEKSDFEENYFDEKASNNEDTGSDVTLTQASEHSTLESSPASTKSSSEPGASSASPLSTSSTITTETSSESSSTSPSTMINDSTTN